MQSNWLDFVSHIPRNDFYLLSAPAPSLQSYFDLALTASPVEISAQRLKCTLVLSLLEFNSALALVRGFFLAAFHV